MSFFALFLLILCYRFLYGINVLKHAVYLYYEAFRSWTLRCKEHASGVDHRSLLCLLCRLLRGSFWWRSK
jgi:hypothetical protein